MALFFNVDDPNEKKNKTTNTTIVTTISGLLLGEELREKKVTVDRRLKLKKQLTSLTFNIALLLTTDKTGYKKKKLLSFFLSFFVRTEKLFRAKLRKRFSFFLRPISIFFGLSKSIACFLL